MAVKSKKKSKQAIAAEGAGAGAGLAAASGAGTILTLFWKLADTDPDQRLSATHHLITILVHQQQQHTPTRTTIQHALPSQHDALKAAASSQPAQDTEHPAYCSDTHAARAERILDHTATPDLAYSLRRLIRGLQSPRQGARQGFAVALAELLAQLAHITPLSPDVVLTLILRDSATTRSAKPAEAREFLFARVFGLHALIRSRFLFQDDDDEDSPQQNGDQANDDEDEGEEGKETPLSPRRVMPGSNLHVFQRTLDILLHDIATRKSWIKQSTTWLLLQTIQALLHIDSADLSWRDAAIDSLRSRIMQFAESRTDMDSLSLSIGISPVLSEEQLQKVFCPPLASVALLSPQNLPVLARIVNELPPADDDSPEGKAPGPGSGAWNPDLHLVWDQLLDLYYPPPSTVHSHLPANLPQALKASQAPLAHFLRVLIDDSLFAPTASPERKSWGFSLVQRVLGRMAMVPARIRDVPVLFQQGFMRTWINQLSDPSRILHKAARNTAQALLTTLQTTKASTQDRSLTALSLLTILLTPPLGLRAFDSITKTRTVDGILATLDGQGLDSYVAFLEGEILGKGEEGEAGRRKWAVDQLLGVVRFRAPLSSSKEKAGEKEKEKEKETGKDNISALRDEAVVLRVLRFVATHGWFEAVDTGTGDGGKKKKRKSLPEGGGGARVTTLDNGTRALLRTRLLSALQDLNAVPVLRLEPDRKKHRVNGVDAASGELWVGKAWGIITELENEKGWRGVEVPVEVVPTEEGEELEEEEGEVEEVFKQARNKAEDVLKILQKLRVQAEKTAKTELGGGNGKVAEWERVRGLEAVLTGTLVYVYLERAAAGELLEPLASAISGILAPKKKKATESEDDSPGAGADEAFVDAMLNLLNRPSAFLRALATQAFGACSDRIGVLGLGVLFESLVPGEGDDVEEEEKEEDEDEEMDEADDDDKDGDEEDEDEDEDEDDEDDETSLDSDIEADTEVDPELRSKVLKALQASGIAENSNGTKDDDESDAESDVTMLDDEQMMKLDDKLASIFRIQAKGKGVQSADEHKEALAQQNKVLDLLDSFAARQAGSPLALSLISPLLSVIRSADREEGRQVAGRAATILRSRLGGAGKATAEVEKGGEKEVDVEKCVKDLEEVHQLATDPNAFEHIGACVSANSILVRAALSSSSSSRKVEAELTRIHRATLASFFQRRGVKPNSAFVREVLVRSPVVGWWLRTDLLGLLGGSSVEAGGKETVRKDCVREGLKLLHAVLVHSLQLPEVTTKEARGFLSDLNATILSILREACTVASSTTATSKETRAQPRMKNLRELVKFAQQAARILKSSPKFVAAKAKATEGPTTDAAEVCNLDGWVEYAGLLAKSETTIGSNKALSMQVQQLIAALRGDAGNKKNKKEKKVVAAAATATKETTTTTTAAPAPAAASAPTLKKKRSRVEEEGKAATTGPKDEEGKKAKVNGGGGGAGGKEEKRVKKVKT